MAAPRADNAAEPVWRDGQLLVEAFVAFNFAGLIADIVIAHSENHFARAAEFVPLYFSIPAAVAVAAIAPLRRRFPFVWRDVGYLVGWLAVLIGCAGLVLHLDSRFFYERTLKSLTYAAPFAAPLAYTGLGLLLIANRMTVPRSIEWSNWIIFLAWAGFVGNFVFSVTDHATNGFFNPIEWVPVAASAAAVGFLIVPLLMEVTPAFVRLMIAVLGIQVAVGVIGFGYHVASVLRQSAPTLLERAGTGAPPLAPMLFPTLAILALIGIGERPR